MKLASVALFMGASLLLADASGAEAPQPSMSDACAAGMVNAGRLNSHGLFDSAAACYRNARKVESAYLLIIGQLRATADLSLLTPSGEVDERAMGELYGFIFYKAGGAGDDELYRDKKLTDRLFAMIRAWNPELPEEYDPGWAYRRRPEQSKYRAAVSHDREARLLQLGHYAQLIRDDIYYSASQEDAEIRRRNNGMLTEGTPDYERSRQLHEIMSSISARYPEPEYPKPPQWEFTPDPEADFRQLHTGFNGQDNNETTIVWSRAEAESSWLAEALTADELSTLLRRVDFAHEMLLIHSIGKRSNATGTVHVTDVDASSEDNAVSISVAIGVNEPDCEWPEAEAYPFVVAIARKTPERPRSRGYYHGNFGDGCKKTAAGKQTPVRVPEQS